MEGGATHSCVSLLREVHMKIQLHHIGLAVGDLDATLDALVDALGAERSPASTADHVLLRVGDVNLALVARKDADPVTRAWGDHLAVTVPAESRDDIVRRLGARGWPSQDVHGRVYVRNPDASLTLELLVT